MGNIPDSLFLNEKIEDQSLVAQIECTAEELGDGIYSQALRHFVGIELDDQTSRHHWKEAIKNWRRIHSQSQDAPGLRAALLDYMHRIAGIIKNPCIVEAEYLQNLRQSSITDELTGLYNQTYFKGYLNRMLDRVGKQDSTGGAVLMFDLDRFKQYNDRCGHLAGDEVLRHAGQLITASLRQGDLACRYGGEEFMILLPNVDQIEALFVAERVRKIFEGTHFDGEELLDSAKLTISGGIALYPDNGCTASELIDHADRELYQAKRRRNAIAPVANPTRRVPRRDIRTLVEIRLPGSQEYIPALSFDISEMGIKIGCQSLDKTADMLSIRFRRPFWPADIELEGKLCWSRCQNTEGMLIMGLEFKKGQEKAGELLPVMAGTSGPMLFSEKVTSLLAR
ncbi:MAG: diguanylate cyclase [Desulfuromonadales bacterium]